MTKYLDKSGLQHFTGIVKEKIGDLSDRIDNVEGRGRYLSNWNCITGLPETDPETLPYPYKTGDYYIVSNAYEETYLDSIDIRQIVGESLSEIEVDKATWRSIVNPQSDITQDFTYTNIEITKTHTMEGDESSLSVINQSLFETKYAAIEQLAIADCAEHNWTFGSFDGISVSWYDEGNGKLVIRGMYTTPNMSDMQQGCLVETYQASSTDTREEDLKPYLEQNYGLKIHGTMLFAKPWTSNRPTFLSYQSSVSANSVWTYLGQPVEDNNLETAYGITYSGTPDVGDIIELEYFVGHQNFRPTGTSYTGVASRVEETEEIKVNDTYLFDGTKWLLLNNTSREIVVDDELSLTSTNPVQNKVITAELNKKSGVIFRTFESEDEEESE